MVTQGDRAFARASPIPCVLGGAARPELASVCDRVGCSEGIAPTETRHAPHRRTIDRVRRRRASPMGPAPGQARAAPTCLRVGSPKAGVARYRVIVVALGGVVGCFICLRVHHGLRGAITSRQELQQAPILQGLDIATVQGTWIGERAAPTGSASASWPAPRTVAGSFRTTIRLLCPSPGHSSRLSASKSRTTTPDSGPTRWAPGLRVGWRPGKRATLASEVSHERSRRRSSTTSENSNRVFHCLAGRCDS
jgi:hypothetical protein